ncbi:hypothetical protein SAMN02982931_04734 [Bauldia litoralis]|uniref:MacB-like periplasmic core domain-containing protein n=2 Tax=Bauldia litoralis TaxID=665467 RepID=A0A1G6EMV2_9HYPH|nr:hypothetical protein SAMN02982931_04734 [Bauldia litoralis]
MGPPMFRYFLVTGLAIVALASSADAGRACGFEDPNSATMQRVKLNLIYPNSLYVQGAVDEALREGVLLPTHFTRPGDFFALQRTTSNLRQFAVLVDDAASDLPQFSMVLMGPVLWTRFHPTVEGITVENHVAGPLPDDLVVVMDVPALAALVSGDVSGAYANETGLVRYYGNPAEIEILRETLAAKFTR